MFLSELGLEQSGLDRLAEASYALLGLISYLTAGEPEVRAWTIRRGTKAPGAAGVIHSDFERGFIRAEIVAYDDLIACGSVAAAKEKGLNVWAYSGWTFEELLHGGNPARAALLRSLDVLVDGKFILEERSLSLQWRGSLNQRLIDVQKSLAENRVVLWEQPVVSWDAL